MNVGTGTRRYAAALLMGLIGVSAYAAEVTISVKPYDRGFPNPLKGFRPSIPRAITGNEAPSNYSHEHAKVYRHYIAWNILEDRITDDVDKIKEWSDRAWAGAAENNVKIIPIVYTQYRTCNTTCPVTNHFPSDWNETEERYRQFIRKLGEAWNNDPRIAWVDGGLVGPWGEQGGLTGSWLEQPICEEYRNAFPNKHVLMRYGSTCHRFGYYPGIYWWSWGCAHQAADAWNAIQHWKDPIVVSGEISYDYCPVNGTAHEQTPNDDLSDSASVDRLCELSRWMHSSACGWISSYTPGPATARGAERFQMVNGYRLVIDTVRYTDRVEPGGTLTVGFSVTNTGSAQFLYPWPVEVSFLDPSTRQPVWKTTFPGLDIRQWLPGDEFDIDPVRREAGTRQYLVPPETYRQSADFTIPVSVPAGEYVLALAILDPGGMLPAARFAVANYWNGGRHPMGRIGVGVDVANPVIPESQFDDLRADESLHYLLVDDNTPPSAPTGLAAQAQGPTVVRLTWDLGVDLESNIARSRVYRDGAKIGETYGTAAEFTDTGLIEGTAYSYQVSCVNGASLESPKSSPVNITTPLDTTPPGIARVSANTMVMVFFDEPMEQASAENAGNYSIDNAVSVSAAALQADLRTVELTVSGLVEDVTYTLTVNNVRDRAKTPNTIAPDTKATFEVISNITMIRFYPRAGMSNRMVGGIFEGTNGDPENGPYTRLYAITSEPPDGQWSEVANLANNEIGYRFVRYRAGGFCNVAEIEFYLGAQKAQGTPYGSPGSWGNSGSDFTKAFDGNVGTYFDYSSDAGGYTGLEIESGLPTGMGFAVRESGTHAPEIRVAGRLLSVDSPGALVVTNARGAVVKTIRLPGPRTVRLGPLPAGVYAIRVTAGNLRSEKTFLVGTR